MVKHKLVTDHAHISDIARRKMLFYICENDRVFREGNYLLLNGYNKKLERFTGQKITAEVTYILPGGYPGIQSGYIALGIKVLYTNF